MENSNHTKTTKVDIQWIFTLFGTAIGAGSIISSCSKLGIVDYGL